MSRWMRAARVPFGTLMYSRIGIGCQAPDPPWVYSGPGLATTHRFGRRVMAVTTLAKNRTACRNSTPLNSTNELRDSATYVPREGQRRAITLG